VRCVMRKRFSMTDKGKVAHEFFAFVTLLCLAFSNLGSSNAVTTRTQRGYIEARSRYATGRRTYLQGTVAC